MPASAGPLAVGGGYVLRAEGSAWKFDGAPTLPTQDEWGLGNHFVATDGTQVAMTSRTPSDGYVINTFEYANDGQWKLTGRFEASLQITSLAIDGDRIAFSQIHGQTGHAEVVTYFRSAAGWQQEEVWEGGGPVAVDGEQVFLYSGAIHEYVVTTRGSGDWRMERVYSPPGSYIGASRLDRGKVFLSARTAAQDVIHIGERQPIGSWRWSTLASPNGAGFTQFGSSFSVSGDLLAVGEVSVGGGRVYLYQHNTQDAAWRLTRTVEDPDPIANNYSFGTSVALYDGALGALASHYNYPMGAFYSFDPGSGALTGVVNAPATGANNHVSVASVDGDRAAAFVSSRQSQPDGEGHIGAIQLFSRTASGWLAGDRIQPPSGEELGLPALRAVLKSSFVTKGDSLYVVGMEQWGVSSRDVILRYQQNADGWHLTERIRPGEGYSHRQIGSIGFVGDIMVVSHGQSGEGLSTLRQSPTGWIPTLLGSVSGWPVVRVDSDTGAVGFGLMTTNGGVSVYQVKPDGSATIRRHLYFGSGPAPTTFAQSSAGVLAVGYADGVRMFRPDSPEGTGYASPEFVPLAHPVTEIANVGESFFVGGTRQDGSGVVQQLAPDGSGWWVGDEIISPQSHPTDGFGARLAVMDGRLLVGAPGQDAASGPQAGAVYVYRVASPARDTEPPLVTGKPSRLPNPDNWYRSPVTVTWTATDNVEGALRPPRAMVVAAEGANQTAVSAPVTDAAGNSAIGTFGPINIDRTAPGIAAVVDGTPNASGWFNQRPTVRFDCSDALSGIAKCTEPVLVAAGKARRVTGTAVDRAGNVARTTVTDLNVDVTPPRVSINGLPSSSYVLGGVPQVACTATDSLSGIDGDCEVVVTGGSPNGLGVFTATATATDRAGNIGRATRTFTVRHAWTGFLQPISDTAHQVTADVSMFKAGSTVPVRFSLRSADGTTVRPNAAPAWVAPTRGPVIGAPDAAFTFPPRGQSATSQVYQEADGVWTYNWQSPATGKGYFWRIGVKLDDGTTRSVIVGLQ